MNETPEEKKARLAKEAADAAAANKTDTQTVSEPPTKLEEVKKLIDLGGGSELENEAKRQYPSLESSFRKSADEEAAGGHPSREFGGAMKGNLAAGLAHSVQSIMQKIQDKKMGNLATVLANKKFLASDPEVGALVNHPEFIKKFPDFWQKIAKKSGIFIQP